NLGFDEPIEFLAGKNTLDAIDKLAQLGLRVSVVQAGHRLEMFDRLELLQRLPSDALGGRIGRGEVGKIFFEVEQFAIERVVLAIGKDRGRLNVIEIIVAAN